MSSAAIAGGSASAEIVPADKYRAVLTIQLTNATALGLAFNGATAVLVNGIKLINSGDVVTVRGHLARGQVNGIGDGAVGAWQDGDLDYKPGPQVAT